MTSFKKTCRVMLLCIPLVMLFFLSGCNDAGPGISSTVNPKLPAKALVHKFDLSARQGLRDLTADFSVREPGADTGVSLLPSEKVETPRIAEAPASLECRHFTTLEVSARRRLAIGEIVHIHVRKGIVDAERLRIDMTQYRPLARLYGNFYASLGDPFTHMRQTYEEWAEEQKNE